MIELFFFSQTLLTGLNYYYYYYEIVFTVLLYNSEKEDAVICEILIEQLQDMAFAIMDGSLITSGY